LQYAHSGYMHLELDNDGNLKRYDAPFAWLMYRGRHFRYGNEDKTPWGHYYVAFKGPRMKKYLKSNLYPLDLDPPVIPISNPDAFLNSMLKMMECLRKGEPGNPEAVHILEGLLLSLRHQEAKSCPDTHFSKGLRKLADDIREHPECEWNFEHEAEKLNLSYVHFRALFRAQISFPPRQFVINCQMDKAEALLHDFRLSLEEIAEKVGIDGVYYFNRLFKQRRHISPGRFRKEFL